MIRSRGVFQKMHNLAHRNISQIMKKEQSVRFYFKTVDISTEYLDFFLSPWHTGDRHSIWGPRTP